MHGHGLMYRACGPGIGWWQLACLYPLSLEGMLSQPRKSSQYPDTYPSHVRLETHWLKWYSRIFPNKKRVLIKFNKKRIKKVFGGEKQTRYQRLLPGLWR